MAQGREIGRPVRLCFVGDGENYHVKKWLPALARAGLHVTLISFDAPAKALDGVEIRLLKRRFPRRSYLNYVQPASELNQLLAQERCDVLIGSYATHYGWLAARTRFSPFVMQTWTGDLTIYPVRWPKRFAFLPVVHYGLSHADLITTDGRALRDLGARYFPEFAPKMIPIRWGIEAPLADPLPLRERQSLMRRLQIDIPESSVVITAPRGLQHWYQPESVIEGLLHALDSAADLFVVLLTLGHDYGAPLDQQLRTLGDHPRAHVIDRFLDGEEMTDVWKATDIVLSVPHADGVSESVLEAVYWGAYPVLSDIPSNQSLIEDGMRATLVPPGSTELPVAIGEAISAHGRYSTERVRALREENSQWVTENATVGQTAAQLAEMVRDLVRQRPRSAT